MVDDNFIRDLMREHRMGLARSDLPRGWFEVNGDRVLAGVMRGTGLSEQDAEARIASWTASRGGSMRRELFRHVPQGAMIPNVSSVGSTWVIVLPEAAIAA